MEPPKYNLTEMVKMKYVIAVFCAVLLAACGGGESPGSTASTPLPFRLASPVSGDPEVALHLYQALYGKAPGYAQLNTFKSQIASNGAVAWANSTASGLSNMSNTEFAALVLNNISITATSLTGTAQFGTPQQAYEGLLGAFVEYLNYVGIANRGVVAAQLAEIISNLEVDTQFGVYGPAAVALNKQIAVNSTYSSNSANTVAADLSTPTANAGVTQTVTVGSIVTLVGSASSDPNGDSLTYSWTLSSRPSGSTATLTSATSAKPTFTADIAGNYVASLTVNDGKVSSTAATVAIAVNASTSDYSRYTGNYTCKDFISGVTQYQLTLTMAGNTATAQPGFRSAVTASNPIASGTSMTFFNVNATTGKADTVTLYATGGIAFVSQAFGDFVLCTKL